jgi:hypothetical protein
MHADRTALVLHDVIIAPKLWRHPCSFALVRWGVQHAFNWDTGVYVAALSSTRSHYASLNFKELTKIDVLGDTLHAMIWTPDSNKSEFLEISGSPCESSEKGSPRTSISSSESRPPRLHMPPFPMKLTEMTIK